MSEKVIVLRRNPIILFSWYFFLIISIGGFVSLYCYLNINQGFAKFVISIFFVLALFLGIKALENNNRQLIFKDGILYVTSIKAYRPIVLETIHEKDIRYVSAPPYKNKILIELYGGKIITLVDFKSSPLPSHETYFMVRAELCKNFPKITKNIIDEKIKDYIENNNVPLSIQNEDSSKRVSVTGLLCLGFIFSILPTFAGLLSLYWLLYNLFAGIGNLLVGLLNTFI